MITNLTMFKRRPGLSLDAFRRYWQTTHGDLALQLPGLRHYVQHPTHEATYRHREPDYDGVAETTWDDLDALRRLRGAGELDQVLADEPNLMDMARRHEIVTDADVIVDGTPGPDAVTMLAFMSRRPDLPLESFHAYWRDVHGPIGLRIPGLRRYVRHHVVANHYTAGRQPVYDGVAETWFDDFDALRAATATDEFAATVADGSNFLAGATPFVICRTIVMR